MLLAALVLAATLSFSPESRAEPQLELEFLHSGETRGATDDIDVYVRLTNRGDAISGSYAGSTVTVSLSSPVSGQYDLPWNDPPSWWDNPSQTMIDGIGENGWSKEWKLFAIDAWPWPGSPGDPVPPGTYKVSATDVDLSLTVALPGATNPVVYAVQVMNDFTWTIADTAEPPGTDDPSSVPLPGTWLLLLAGLSGLAARRLRA